MSTPSEPRNDQPAGAPTSSGDPGPRVDLVKGDDSESPTQIVSVPPVDDFVPSPDPYQATQMAPPSTPVGNQFGDPWASSQPYQADPSYPSNLPYQQPGHMQPDYSQIQFNQPPAPVPPYGQPVFAQPPSMPGYGQPYGASPYGAYGTQYPTGSGAGSDPKAIIALILGLISFPLAFACYIGVATAVVGAVLGGVAIAEANRTQNRTNRGMAIGGLVLAIVDLLLIVLLFSAVIAFS